MRGTRGVIEHVTDNWGWFLKAGLALNKTQAAQPLLLTVFILIIYKMRALILICLARALVMHGFPVEISRACCEWVSCGDPAGHMPVM